MSAPTATSTVPDGPTVMSWGWIPMASATASAPRGPEATTQGL